MQRAEWTPTTTSPPETRARITRQRIEWTPSMAWISWDTVKDKANQVTPPVKKARLEGGQTTLTQFENDSVFQSPPSPKEATVAASSPDGSPSEDEEESRSKDVPKVVQNDVLAGLLWELHENCEVLMEQIETAYPWFSHFGFPQKKWIQELPEAISAVKRCPGLVSVMGLKDMQRFLPTITNRHTFVLLKQLAVHHFFHILLDLDQFSVTATFKIVHKEGNIGAGAWVYGTDAEVEDDIFYPTD